MIYVVTAFKAEAECLIDFFALKLKKKSPFSIYEAKDLKVIISGIGAYNSAIATSHLLSSYPSPKRIINFGIAASTKDGNIGDIYKIKKIIDKPSDKVYHLESGQASITTVAKAQDHKSSINSDLVDMESSGFYLSSKSFLELEKIEIYKIVSDFLDPKSIDKNSTKKLLSKNIDKIIKEII